MLSNNFNPIINFTGDSVAMGPLVQELNPL